MIYLVEVWEGKFNMIYKIPQTKKKTMCNKDKKKNNKNKKVKTKCWSSTHPNITQLVRQYT